MFQFLGHIYFNKAPASKYFNRNLCYVPQEDIHISTLTVREIIYYSAWVRLPEGTSHEQMDIRVTELIGNYSIYYIINYK